MNYLRGWRVGAAVALCVSGLALFILPERLTAQPLPQVFYVSELSRVLDQSMGPDISDNHHYYFGRSEYNPLIVNNVRLVSTYHCDGSTETTETTIDFDGNYEAHDGYFSCRSCGGSATINGVFTPVYRTSKITLDGFYLQDDYSYEVNNQNPFLEVSYSYNQNMKLQRAVYSSNDGYWDKLECEVDSLGRRLQDIWYSSSDSLIWNPRIRKRYIYNGSPLRVATEFEKYNSYPSAFYIRPTSVYTMPMYVNNDWDIDSVGYSFWDNGDWSYEQMGVFHLHETPSGYYAYYFQSQWNWDVNGLPTALNLPNGYDVWGYSLVYRHSSQTQGEDELVNPASRLLIWPNPSQGQSRLKLNIASPTDVSVETYNLKGQLIKRENFHHSPGIETDFCWNACDAFGKDFKNGIYILKVIWKGGSSTSRIVVMH